MIFGRAKLRALEADNKRLQDNNQAPKNQVEYLVRTLRDMDNQIFKMSQASSWDQMRPNFQTLAEGMTARKVAESNRIAEIIRPELITTYTITPQHGQIDGRK